MAYSGHITSSDEASNVSPINNSLDSSGTYQSGDPDKYDWISNPHRRCYFASDYRRRNDTGLDPNEEPKNEQTSAATANVMVLQRRIEQLEDEAAVRDRDGENLSDINYLLADRVSEITTAYVDMETKLAGVSKMNKLLKAAIVVLVIGFIVWRLLV